MLYIESEGEQGESLSDTMIQQLCLFQSRKVKSLMTTVKHCGLIFIFSKRYRLEMTNSHPLKRVISSDSVC